MKSEKRQSTPSMTKMGHAQNVCHFRLFNPVGNCNLRENKLERRGYIFLVLSLKANEPKAKHVGGSSDGFSLCIHTGDPCRSHSWCLSRSFVASQTGSCISSGHRLCPPCLAAENMACEWGGAGVRGLEGGQLQMQTCNVGTYHSLLCQIGIELFKYYFCICSGHENWEFLSPFRCQANIPRWAVYL